MTGPYAGATFTLLTQHGKERVFRPRFAETFGAQVELVLGVDTDALGTFTREVPRAGTQREAALAKARLGMERAGAPLGLASEGAFLPGPLGFGAWDVELAVLVDAASGVEVVGWAEGVGRHVHGLVETRSELEALAALAGFPEHGLVLRPDGEDDPRVWKGLSARGALEEAWAQARAAARTGRVFVENDLRAHLNPTRMEVVDRAVLDLVRRLERQCVACGAPGFGLVAPVPGLPCADCGTPTRQARAEMLGCVRCDHREERPLARGEAEPRHCEVCNP